MASSEKGHHPFERQLVQVALPLPVDQTFTYIWPSSLQRAPVPGLRVLLPFGRRRLAGFVLNGTPAQAVSGLPGKHPEFDCKEVLALLDDEPLFGKRELRFYEWISRYYLAPLGEVLKTALPVSVQQGSYQAVRILDAGLASLKSGVFLTAEEMEILRFLGKKGKCTRKELNTRTSSSGTRLLQSLIAKGFVETCQVLKGKKSGFSRQETVPATAAADRPALTPSPAGTPPDLTAPQAQALERILPPLRDARFHAFLLHGVTGSGKTEVYLRAIDHTLRTGRQAIFLIPEIGLTPQAVRRVAERFGDTIAVLHSRLTDRERLDYWWRIRLGQVKIAIGARSAVFAPFQNLGLIVVDEEHDSSYKQQDRVRYHARDLALVRGKMENAVVILGSATPALESYFNARQKKYTLLDLPERVQGRPMPEVETIDMRFRSTPRDPAASLSPALETAIRDNLAAGRKTLLFLNRRGYAHTLACKGCGHLFRCPRCSVSLTYHRLIKRLCCHYCEYQRPTPLDCPACQGTDLQPVGRGTERIEEEIRSLAPQARASRMDRDTTRRKGAHERILRQFEGEELDLLIGTQMIAKGHDIPEVTLVGVILADVSLDLPDFRAAERTFQLLLQVSGRAGRGDWPGRVLIQTFHPEHYCVRAACRQDYRDFYDQEILFREELGYPPFSRMVNLRLTGPVEEQVRAEAERLGETARSILAGDRTAFRDMEVLGPSLAPLARIRGRYRYHCFLKGSPPHRLLAFTRQVLADCNLRLTRSRMQLEVDVDPIQVL